MDWVYIKIIGIVPQSQITVLYFEVTYTGMSVALINS